MISCVLGRGLRHSCVFGCSWSRAETFVCFRVFLVEGWDIRVFSGVYGRGLGHSCFRVFLVEGWDIRVFLVGG